jgi:hypothetical protein
VLLDLSGLASLDSAGLGQGIRLNQRVRKAGGTLKVCGVCPPLWEVLHMFHRRLAECHSEGPADPDTVLALFRNTFPANPPGLRLTGPAGRTARDLARAIHDDGRFEDLPVLADALEEAGCTDSEVLVHCRHGGLHGRSCWVLAWLLGEGGSPDP